MPERAKLRNLIRNAMADSLYDHSDLRMTRAYHRNQLLQDVATDIQMIVSESGISVEAAIDEWISNSDCKSTGKSHRRQVAEDALRRFPEAVNF